MPGNRLTPRARIGFRNILEYVEGKFGVRVAERVLGKLEAGFEMLAASPGLGHGREDLTADERVRFWSVSPTLIAYWRVADIIETLFVEPGERGWKRLLEDDLCLGG